MAGLLRAHLLILFAGITLRNTFAQDTCGANDHFALFVHDDGIDTQDGIYKATVPFDAGSDFTKLPLATTENPTAVYKDVVEDLVYWAGNDIHIGRYIKSDVKTGGTTQDTSLITCVGTPLGIEDGTILNAEISVPDWSNADSKIADQSRARLDQAADLGSNLLGAWVANDGTDPWIAVNFLGRPTVTGVILQGRQDAPMWTETYEVQYSNDEVTWNTVPDANGNDAVFVGDTDQNIKVTQTFAKPVVALYIRIVPLSWYYDDTSADTTVIDAPALRFELLGCEVPKCTAPASSVLTDGSILDSQLTASSGTASDGRYMTGTWVATTDGSTGAEWVRIDLGGRVKLGGVTIAAGTDGWPTMLTVRISQDGVSWTDVSMLATTGLAANGELHIPLSVSATHVEISVTETGTSDPVKMGFDVIGCREPEITRIAVDGTCAARRLYWIERGGQTIYYALLDDENPTANALLTINSGTIVDFEFDLDNDLIYFATQDGDSSPPSSTITRARLSSGAILSTVTVSSTVIYENSNIQSISVDWDTERVYYSINADTDNAGSIGYVNFDLSSNTVIYTITGDPASTFYPFDIGVYGDYVYALEDKDSIIRVLKSLTGTNTGTTNPKETVVNNADSFARLAVDLQIVKCIDYPTISIKEAPYSLFEQDSIADVTINREGDLRCCSVLNLLTAEGTSSYLAKDPEDFSLLPNAHVDQAASTVTFQAGEEAVELQFQIVQDNNIPETVGEGDEKFSVTLTANNCAALGSPFSTEVTIKDDYSCYYIDPDNERYEILEGDTDQIQSLALMRRGNLPQPGTINVAFIDGTATIFDDYKTTVTTADFLANSATGSIPVTIVGDDDLEDREEFCIQLAIPTGASNTYLCSGEIHKACINITDNDFTVYLRETHITTSEDAGTVLVPVCREGYRGDGSVTVAVTVHEISGSAEAGNDYVNNINQVIFQENQECTNAEITLLDDEDGEPNEAFRVEISNPSKGQLGDENTETYVGITDDDIAIRIEENEYSVDEGGRLFVKLIREGDLDDDENVILVAIPTSQTTAIPGEDYVDIGEVPFNIGDKSKSVAIDIIDDTQVELSETFRLSLLNGAGDEISSAIVTIEDNDVAPPATGQRYFFDRSSLVVDEYNNLQVAVIRTLAEEPGSVQVLTTSGTATAGTDFTSLTIADPESVAEFAEGSTRATVTIQINDDNNVEGDESFTAQLFNPSDGSISSNNNVLITIDDDDDDDVDDGGDGDDGTGDEITLSTAALVGIILGAAILLLTLLGLAVCGCCMLLRQPAVARPPLYAQPPPPAYGYGPRYTPPYDGYNARDNRAFRPV